jgi:methyl-accepting chemotaxis protein
MDMRTKLVLVLVFLSIGSMAVLGLFSYNITASLLEEIAQRQLVALAESRAQDLENVVDGWRDHTRLIRSRTQLRRNLARYNRYPEPEIVQDMQRILSDAQRSTPNVLGIALYSPSGELLVQAGSTLATSPNQLPWNSTEIRLQGVHHSEDALSIEFGAALQVDEQFIGGLAVAFNVDEVRNVAADYTGLGDHGETIVIGHNPQGGRIVLHALRHASGETVDITKDAELYTDGVLIERLGERIDYRSRRVWTASRQLAEPGWVVLVNLDIEEESVRLIEFRDILVKVGLALSGFAIIGGTLLGIVLARPLVILTETVERVRNGETSLRSDIQSEDEVGFLALALNEFLDQMAQDPGPADDTDD